MHYNTPIPPNHNAVNSIHTHTNMRSSNTTIQYLLLVISIFYRGAHSLALPRLRASIPAPKTTDKKTKYIVAIACASLGGLLLLSALAYALYVLSRKKKKDEDETVERGVGMERRPTLTAFTFGPRRGTVFGGLVRRGTSADPNNGEEGRELLGEKAEMGDVSPLTPVGVEGLGGSGEKEKV